LVENQRRSEDHQTMQLFMGGDIPELGGKQLELLKEAIPTVV
jgi:hypothetical protein